MNRQYRMEWVSPVEPETVVDDVVMPRKPHVMPSRPAGIRGGGGRTRVATPIGPFLRASETAVFVNRS
jgi:hypothetical protein